MKSQYLVSSCEKISRESFNRTGGGPFDHGLGHRLVGGHMIPPIRQHRSHISIESLKCLSCGSLVMTRSFNDWWDTIPSQLKEKAWKSDEANKPLLNQVNSTLISLEQAGNYEAKPSHEELRNWLHSGQIDIVKVK